MRRVRTVGVALGASCFAAWLYTWGIVPGFAKGTVQPPTVAAPASDTGPWTEPVALGGLNLAAPHHDYPAIDLPLPAGAVLHAMRPGTVSYVGGDCGLGIKIIDASGTAVKFCHAAKRLVSDGAQVDAGQPVATAGATGHTEPPGFVHLHFEVLVNGANRCPQPLLQALRATGVGVDPTTLPASGCTY